jgi:hypothetical protein
MQLLDAGQLLMDATTRESYDEVIAAKLRWHHVVAAVKRACLKPRDRPG